jgi:hypothetical protein
MLRLQAFLPRLFDPFALLSVIAWHRPVSYWRFAPLCCPEMVVTDQPTPCNTQMSERSCSGSGYQNNEHCRWKCTRIDGSISE